MKLKSLFFILIWVSSTIIARAQNGKSSALVGVEIFNGEIDDLTDMTIIIEEEKIKDIFKTGSKLIPDSITQLDLTGHYVIPGLIDSHVHMGMRALSKSPATSRKEFRKWLYSGVTSVRDMGGDARALANENLLIQQNKQPGPDIYYSATVGSTDMIEKDGRLKNITQGIGIEKAGYVIEAYEGMDIKKSISMAVESKVSGVKFYAGINSNLIKDIAQEAHNQGLKCWAHFTVFPDRPIEVVKSGVDVVSHVWGAFWQDNDVDPAERIPFTHTSFKEARSASFPGDVSVLNTDSPELKMLFNELVQRNVIWDLTYAVKNPETRKLYKKYALAARQAGVTFSTGTDNFNDITAPFPSLFDEMEQLVLDNILNSKQAIEAATYTGAKVIGIENTHGSIEIGKIANLVVLRKNPMNDIKHLREIEFTMKNGYIYYRKDYK